MAPRASRAVRFSETLEAQALDDAVQLQVPSAAIPVGSRPSSRSMVGGERRRVRGQTAEMHAFLDRVGVDRKCLQKGLETFPAMTRQDLDANLDAIVTFFTELGVSQAHLAKILCRCPVLLTYSVPRNLRPKIEFLQELGLQTQQLAKLAQRMPHFFGYSMERKLKPAVEFLLRIGISKENVPNILASVPTLVAYSQEDNMEPTIAFLQSVGLSRTDLAKMITTLPQVLAYSVTAKIEPIVLYLRSALGLNDQQISRVLSRAPSVLGRSLDRKLKPTVRYFLEELRVSRADLARMVNVFPPLLTLNLEDNLKPKMTYLYEELRLGVDDVISFPAYFGYSMQQRIVPRHQFLIHVGLRRSLSAMLCPSDAKFVESVHRPLDDFLTFRARINKSDDIIDTEDKVETSRSNLDGLSPPGDTSTGSAWGAPAAGSSRRVFFDDDELSSVSSQFAPSLSEAICPTARLPSVVVPRVIMPWTFDAAAAAGQMVKEAACCRELQATLTPSKSAQYDAPST